MDLKLDNFGDLAIEDEDLVLLDGVDAIGQDISIRLQTFLGEWFLDTRVGMPYFTKILGQKPRIAATRALFRKAIIETAGVQKVNDLVLDFEGATRTLSVSFTAATTSGPLTYDKEFIL